MSWANHGEVARVNGGYLGCVDPLSCGDDAGIGAAEWEVGILGDEFAHAGEIFGKQRGDHSVAALG